MALRTRSRLIAILVGATTLLAVLGGVAVRADPSPPLPSMPADRVLANALSAVAQPFTISGEVQTTVDVGLPELPTDLAGGAGGQLTTLLGRQTYKVWHAPGGIRIAHIFGFSEQDLVANRREAWSWDSDGMIARQLHLQDVRAALRQATSARGPWAAAIAGDPTVPAHADVVAAAGGALEALAPYADVSVDGTATVAGRPVYQLVLTPRSAMTLIGRITIAIDAESWLPLRFQVIPKGSQDAAIEAGFTSVSFDAIDPSVFTFRPPPGATVARMDPTGLAKPHGTPPMLAPRVPPVTFGSGFDARVAIELNGPLPSEAAMLLPYAGPLASAITVGDGTDTWLLFGFVGIDTLRADARTLPLHAAA